MTDIIEETWRSYRDEVLIKSKDFKLADLADHEVTFKAGMFAAANAVAVADDSYMEGAYKMAVLITQETAQAFKERLKADEETPDS